MDSSIRSDSPTTATAAIWIDDKCRETYPRQKPSPCFPTSDITHVAHGLPGPHDLLPEVTVDQLLEEKGNTVLHTRLKQLQQHTGTAAVESSPDSYWSARPVLNCCFACCAADWPVASFQAYCCSCWAAVALSRPVSNTQHSTYYCSCCVAV
jgi:hypothetical protein